MADRKDYYFRQLLTEAELDEGFDQVEAADRAIMADQGLEGVFQGGQVTEQLTPSLNVDVAGPGLCYDQLGRRIAWTPTQVVSLAADELAASTAVVTPGNAKVLSVFVEFDRALSDARTDGNSANVFFHRAESFTFNVVQGAEVLSGAEVAPPLRDDQLLLADITLVYGQTQVLNADIDSLTRRQDAFVLTGSPNSEREGTVRNVLQAFQDQINDFINSGSTFVGYAGGGAWADGTTNPAASVEAQLDKIVADLAGATGLAKVQAAASTSWLDATSNPADTAQARLDKIIADLSATTGAAKVGLAASVAATHWPSRAAESIAARLQYIQDELGAAGGSEVIGGTASGFLSAGSVHAQLSSVANRALGGITYPVNLNTGDPTPMLNDGAAANLWTYNAVNIGGADQMAWEQNGGAEGSTLSFDVSPPWGTSCDDVTVVYARGLQTAATECVLRLKAVPYNGDPETIVGTVSGPLIPGGLFLVPGAHTYDWLNNRYIVQVYSEAGHGAGAATLLGLGYGLSHS